MWKWDALQTLLTWVLKEKVSSMVTPRLLTESKTVIEALPSVNASIRPSCLVLAPVPITIASDLSGLRARPFSVNHRCTTWKQLSSVFAASFWSSMYNWVSSAYWVWWTPNEGITPATGATYIEKSAGPRTEPCGTPNSQDTAVDRSFPIRTYWDRSSRYVFSQRSADPVFLLNKNLPCGCSNFLVPYGINYDPAKTEGKHYTSAFL